MCTGDTKVPTDARTVFSLMHHLVQDIIESRSSDAAQVEALVDRYDALHRLGVLETKRGDDSGRADVLKSSLEDKQANIHAGSVQ